jgi:hypothetical protein
MPCLWSLFPKRIFVGYIENSKAYKVYIPSLRKTVIMKDRALRKAHDTGSPTTGDRELET